MESVEESSVLVFSGIPCFSQLGKACFSSEKPTLPHGSFSSLYWDDQQIFIMGKKWSNRRLVLACLLVFGKKKKIQSIDLPPDSIS